MNQIFEILKYILPSLVIFLTIWVVLKYFLKVFEKQKATEVALRNRETTLGLRLQAYERLVLFLERISLDSLLTRVNQPGMSSRQLHNELLSSIRSEYEHNLSQQVYVSNKGWEALKNARAQMIKVINTSAEKTDPNASAIDLSRNIIERLGDFSKPPTQTAIEILKEEIQEML
jgi:hypothetical protein